MLSPQKKINLFTKILRCIRSIISISIRLTARIHFREFHSKGRKGTEVNKTEEVSK